MIPLTPPPVPCWNFTEPWVLWTEIFPNAAMRIERINPRSDSADTYCLQLYDYDVDEMACVQELYVEGAEAVWAEVEERLNNFQGNAEESWQ